MDVKVFIFEDNQLIRQGLEAIINGTPGYTCCGTASNSNNWESSLYSHKPDVILMDIEMPGMNGIETTQKIKEQLPDVKILIQTVFDDSDSREPSADAHHGVMPHHSTRLVTRVAPLPMITVHSGTTLPAGRSACCTRLL